MEMAKEVSIRIFIRGKRPTWRLNNIKALALKYFPTASGKKGNVTALFHDALNAKWNLNPETSLPMEPLSEQVADAPPKSKKGRKSA
jgi:hypothetical protein